MRHPFFCGSIIVKGLKCADLIFLLGLLSYQNFIEIMMETMQTMTHWGKLKTVLEGYVGFDTVQEQIRKKSLKRGFEFNLMVVGKLIVNFVIYRILQCVTYNIKV